MLQAKAEADFWKTRRKAILNVSQNEAWQKLASLPLSFQTAPPIRSPFKTLRILSELDSRKRPPQKTPRLQNLLDSLSPEHLKIHNISAPKTPRSGRFVIFMQDVHMNFEAQSNLSRALQNLMKNDLVNVVGLEGDFNPISLAPFRNYPVPGVQKNVADFLIKKQQISGPVHAGLVTEGSIPNFVGVDDQDHYAANVRASVDSLKIKHPAKKDHEKRGRWLKESKKESFNSKLREFDLILESFHEKSLDLGPFVQKLARHVSKLPKTLKAFNEAYSLEKNLDFERVKTERAEILNFLIKVLDPQELSYLMEEALAYRKGGGVSCRFLQYA